MVSDSESTTYESVTGCIDEVIDRLGPDITAAAPLGLGKPNYLVNELVGRAVDDSSIDLTLWTALTLTKPTWNSELERRLVEPMSDRLFGDYPGVMYANLMRAGELPDNIEIHEFYFPPGEYLDIPAAQQTHRNVNYTYALDEIRRMDVDVLLQMVGVEQMDGETYYNLSSNTDLSADVIPMLHDARDEGRETMVVAQVNRNMPAMAGDAAVPADQFDAVVDSPEYEHQLFGTPRRPIEDTDYAIGLRVSSLLRDGGTLQIGIGSLGDAIARAAIVRDDDSDAYQDILDELDVLEGESFELIREWGGTGAFEEGLYGGTELFTDAYVHLADAGVLDREVYHDIAIQRLADEGLTENGTKLDAIERLLELDAIGNPLEPHDVEYLQTHGLLDDNVRCRDDGLTDGDRQVDADIFDEETRVALRNHWLSDGPTGGTLVDAAFFLGSSDFYDRLREMPDEKQQKFAMRSVQFTNQLLRHEQLNRLQRRHARFVNTAMKVTVTGAAVSDGLEDNRVVSGVGGQFNFVDMAHQLEDGRSIIMVRATRESGGRLESNIVWNYGHATIPRHLRDIVVTEYGIADLRGKCDADVIASMIEIADARFQDELVKRAKSKGKLPEDYELPVSARRNTPEHLSDSLAPYREDDSLPDFPFGTELTELEVDLTRALRTLQATVEGGLPDLDSLANIVDAVTIPEDAEPYLQRMGLSDPDGFQELTMRHAVAFALTEADILSPD